MDMVIDELSMSCCTTKLLELAGCSERVDVEGGKIIGSATGHHRRQVLQAEAAGGELAASRLDTRLDPLQASVKPTSAGPLRVADEMKTSSRLGHRATGSANNNGQEPNAIDNNSNNCNAIGGGNLRFQGAHSKPFFRQYLPNSFNLNQNHSSKGCRPSQGVQKSTCTTKSASKLDTAGQYEQQVEQATTNSSLGQYQANQSKTAPASKIRRRVIDGGQHQNELRGSSRSLVNRLTSKLQAAKLLVASTVAAPLADKDTVSRRNACSDKIISRPAKQKSQASSRRKGFLYLKEVNTCCEQEQPCFVKLVKERAFGLSQSRAQRRLKGHEQQGQMQVKLLEEERQERIRSHQLSNQMAGPRSVEQNMEPISINQLKLPSVSPAKLLGGWRASSALRLLAATALLAAIGALLGCASSALALQQAGPPAPFRSQQPVPGGPLASPQRLANQAPGALPQPAAGSLVANVNCNKIRGHVTLTPNMQGGSTVSTQISAGPPGEVYQWSVHQFPIKPGSAMCSCSALILGAKLLDLSEMHGNLPSDQEFSVQSSLNLFGPDSPVGHSLLLRGIKTGMVACATFLPTR